MIANDGMHIEKGECLRQCAEWEGELSHAHISSLFAQGDKVNFETFNTWIEKNYEVRIVRTTHGTHFLGGGGRGGGGGGGYTGMPGV